ncbi:MAG: hypothetical protein QXZ70_03685 [Candidatus Bathyarchaeia archaeon]
MNATLKRMFVILAISAMLVGSSVLVAVNAQNNETEEPVGKEIASTFREIAKTHQGDIEDFILETKVDVAETNEAKLDILDEYINGTLRAKINEVTSEREALIAQYEAGEIDNETFRMEMKALSLSLATTAKTMGELGEKLGKLGQNLAGALENALNNSLQVFKL